MKKKLNQQYQVTVSTASVGFCWMLWAWFKCMAADQSVYQLSGGNAIHQVVSHTRIQRHSSSVRMQVTFAFWLAIINGIPNPLSIHLPHL